jgi:LmbE family N-acetylglucosaminyl deacetylase
MNDVLPLLPTTMVGAYPRPSWFTQQLDGRDVREAFKSLHHEEAFRDAVRAVVADVRPHVVVSLDVVTSDGHRDHDRIAAATVAAVADHPDVLVYAWCVPRAVLEQWFTHLAMARPDSPYAQGPPAGFGRPMEQVTTILDQHAFADLRVRASAAHASQRPPFDGMPADLIDLFMGTDHLVRLQPPWDGGEVERSLPL